MATSVGMGFFFFSPEYNDSNPQVRIKGLWGTKTHGVAAESRKNPWVNYTQ